MAYKFIPDGDSPFALMAEKFAGAIAMDPGRFKLSGEDAARISMAADDFRRALGAANNKSLRSDPVLKEKDRLRAQAEDVIRLYANAIRVNLSISPIDKMRAGIKERPTKLKTRKCPQTSPLLTFRGARDADATRGPVHVLEFREEPYRDLVTREMAPPAYRAKPEGATRVELYMELVDEGEPLPKHPGELSGGRPWYVQSFTRSPMQVNVAVCARPMMVVYWACWAGANGKRGPFSKTCVARVEGWSDLPAALPEPAETRRRQQRVVITSARKELPEPQREAIELREVKLLEEAA